MNNSSDIGNDPTTHQVVINKINGQEVSIAQRVDVPVRSKVKVTATAYVYHVWQGTTYIAPFRHVKFTVKRYYSIWTEVEVWHDIVLTNGFGVASTTYEANYPGEYIVYVDYYGSGSYWGDTNDYRHLIVSQPSIDDQSGEPDNGSSQNLNSNETAPTETVPMQDTGAPMGMLVLSILAILCGLFYTKK